MAFIEMDFANFLLPPAPREPNFDTSLIERRLPEIITMAELKRVRGDKEKIWMSKT